MTRQLAWPSPDPEEGEELWQLSLTFRFSPEQTLRELPAGNRWCLDARGLREFETFVGASPALALVRTRVPREIALEYGPVD
jgi:hypothetical protein